MFTLKFRIVLTEFTLRITIVGQGYSEILSPISWASKRGEKIKKPHPKSSWSLFLGDRLTPQCHCAIFLDGLEVHPSIWGMWKGERDPGTGPCQSHPSLIQQGWNSSFPDANAKVFNACIKNRGQCGKESSRFDASFYMRFSYIPIMETARHILASLQPERCAPEAAGGQPDSLARLQPLLEQGTLITWVRR